MYSNDSTVVAGPAFHDIATNTACMAILAGLLGPGKIPRGLFATCAHSNGFCLRFRWNIENLTCVIRYAVPSVESPEKRGYLEEQRVRI